MHAQRNAVMRSVPSHKSLVEALPSLDGVCVGCGRTMSFPPTIVLGGATQAAEQAWLSGAAEGETRRARWVSTTKPNKDVRCAAHACLKLQYL